MQDIEIWKDVVGYEGIYQISCFGRLKNIIKGNFLNPSDNSAGYFHVNLSKNGKYKSMKFHRILLMAFVENPENKREVNHINGIKSDNRLENLEWVTCSENVKHAVKTGLKPRPLGEKNIKAKLTNEQIFEIRSFSNNRSRKTVRFISNRFGITWQQANKIVKGQAWKHLL